jgi:hypothetical protein
MLQLLLCLVCLSLALLLLLQGGCWWLRPWCSCIPLQHLL